jgi:hypothetical protein
MTSKSIILGLLNRTSNVSKRRGINAFQKDPKDKCISTKWANFHLRIIKIFALIIQRIADVSLHSIH